MTEPLTPVNTLGPAAQALLDRLMADDSDVTIAEIHTALLAIQAEARATAEAEIAELRRTNHQWREAVILLAKALEDEIAGYRGSTRRSRYALGRIDPLLAAPPTEPPSGLDKLNAYLDHIDDVRGESSRFLAPPTEPVE